MDNNLEGLLSTTEYKGKGLEKLMTHHQVENNQKVTGDLSEIRWSLYLASQIAVLKISLCAEQTNCWF